MEKTGMGPLFPGAGFIGHLVRANRVLKQADYEKPLKPQSGG
jgi:hypothetical protein